MPAGAALPGGKAIRVGIVEDDDRIREGLAVMLDGTEGLRCVGNHPSAEAALRLLPGQQPEVVLMDINLPGMSGIECAGKLKERLPGCAILMLTVYEDSEQIFQALRHGAAGYLVKRTSPAKLIEAIEDTHRGGSPMSSGIARKVVQYFHQLGRTRPEGEQLSPREQEILECLAKGFLYKEIGEALAISVETVRSHLSSIYRKLHVRTRTEAVIKFLGQ
jgi:DNA-binding NarL/FixJ family response regulator